MAYHMKVDFDNLDEDKWCYFRYINPEFGYGLFARRFIPKNTVIGIYGGDILEIKKGLAYAWRYWPYQVENNIIRLDAKYYGNLLRYANDL